MKKILILTVRHGAAHERMAFALTKALGDLRSDLLIEVADTLEHCAGWFRSYYNSYELPLRYWPALWSWIEKFQHQSTSSGPAWLYRRGAKPLFQFIRKFGPDVVIATEVAACELAAMFKRKTRAPFYLVGAAGGLDMDLSWAQPEVDLFPIAPCEPAERLEAVGIPRAKLLPCGTPIDPAFESLPDRSTIRKRLNADPKVPLVLALFGGTGFGNPGKIILELRKVQRPFQAVFIAGRNRRLEEETRRCLNGLPFSRVLGWVDNMHEWMAAAELLVTKPGGLTVVEALACGLPLIAFDPLPGYEQRACQWIERRQVGIWVKRQCDLAPSLERLLTDQQELDFLRQRSLALGRPQAARVAASAILDLLDRANQPVDGDNKTNLTQRTTVFS